MSTKGLIRQPHLLGTAWRTPDGRTVYVHWDTRYGEVGWGVKGGDWMPMVRHAEGQGLTSLPEPHDPNPSLPTTTATFRTLREAREYVDAWSSS